MPESATPEFEEYLERCQALCRDGLLGGAPAEELATRLERLVCELVPGSAVELIREIVGELLMLVHRAELRGVSREELRQRVRHRLAQWYSCPAEELHRG